MDHDWGKKEANLPSQTEIIKMSCYFLRKNSLLRQLLDWLCESPEMKVALIYNNSWLCPYCTYIVLYSGRGEISTVIISSHWY